MKGLQKGETVDQTIIFISHMVQMKDASLIAFARLSKSFISHMVQMKVRFNDATTWNKISLYIPHGSDESNPVHSNNFSKNDSLYPTWFRWKKN